MSMATLLVAPEATIEDAENSVKRRLIGVHGVRLSRSGLDGTRPYREIAAHSVQASDFAEEALKAIAGITDEKWSNGWTLRDGDLTLRVYPT
jgi:hypothetical protein